MKERARGKEGEGEIESGRREKGRRMKNSWGGGGHSKKKRDGGRGPVERERIS